jgi:hypothetical protein
MKAFHRNTRQWRNLRLQPNAAFSRFLRALPVGAIAHDRRRLIRKNSGKQGQVAGAVMPCPE